MQASRNTQIKTSLAIISSLGSAGTARLIAGGTLTPILVGAAVLSAHASSILGDLSIGNAISKTRTDLRRQGAILAKNGLSTQQNEEEKVGQDETNNLGKSSPKISKNEDKNRNVIEGESKGMVGNTSSAASLEEKSLSKEPHPSANPNNRRLKWSANDYARNDRFKHRVHVPIAGEDAAAWVKSRAEGKYYPPKESHPPYRLAELPFAKEIRVAIIADDFTFFSYEPEFNAKRLTPSNWRQVFEEHQPQVFFCESAWQGGDPKTRPWQGKIYASVRWPSENRSVLLEILDHCHAIGIPTVFWNKEDPTHFGDRINDFIRTAALFDYVFTTAEECVDSYRKDADVKNIDVLPFAVQPQMFNPQGIHSAANSANFAGTWYGNYPERCAAAASIMDQVLDSGIELVIYDRMYSSPNPIYRYPERFAKYTRPSIPYTKLPNSYRKSRYGITLNTVTDSKTMFARRAFELAASGSVVLSNYALGVHEFFGDSILYPDKYPGVLQDLNETEYRDLQQKSMDVALQNTYAHRAEQILTALGIEYQSQFTSVTGAVVVKTMDEYEIALRNFRRNSGLQALLAIASIDQEQSLEMNLLMRGDQNVTVLSEESLRNQEYRVRNYLSSPAIVMSGDAQDWMPSSSIRRLFAHSSHFSGAIKNASTIHNRYRVSALNDASDTLIPATYVGKFFAGIGDVPLFEV